MSQLFFPSFRIHIRLIFFSSHSLRWCWYFIIFHLSHCPLNATLYNACSSDYICLIAFGSFSMARAKDTKQQKRLNMEFLWHDVDHLTQTIQLSGTWCNCDCILWLWLIICRNYWNCSVLVPLKLNTGHYYPLLSECYKSLILIIIKYMYAKYKMPVNWNAIISNESIWSTTS